MDLEQNSDEESAMKDCQCENPKDVAIVTTAFMVKPEDWQIAFVREHAGKLICYQCGGFVNPERVNNQYDHVTASTVTDRLCELGHIGPGRMKIQ
jgi:hypothetical protein